MKPVTVIAISFFFSSWGDRLWNFAVGLYLVKLTPGSLQLAAVYGLVVTASTILFSPVVGDWIDNNNRLKAVRFLLILTNLFIFLCAICILVYLYEVTSNPIWLKIMQAVIILLGAAAYLAGVGEKICVSRDWIVVVCKLDKDMLANANALLRRIDLSVAILAPVGVGLLMTVVSDLAGIVFICLWNIITMFAEYFLLLHVYKNDVNLHQRLKDDANETLILNREDKSSERGEKEPLKVSVQTFSNTMSNLNFFRRFKAMLFGWKVYQRQSVALAGFALAWLYLTVLGFNAITTSYAFSQGLKEVYISICFGLGSLVGIAGTFLFPVIRNKIGLLRTGLVGNILQISMLSMCVVSIWLPGSPSSLLSNTNKEDNYTHYLPGNVTEGPVMPAPTEKKSEVEYTSIVVLMLGIILSRSGLWIADLTITQLQQENVSAAERGTVGGVQHAFNSLFDLLHYVITICFPYPHQFWILILMSVCAMLSSFTTYFIFNLRFEMRADYEEIE